MYSLKDKVTELANYVQSEDDMNSISAESACDDMISSVADSVTSNAGSFTEEDYAMMIPAFQAASPAIVDCLNVFSVMVCIFLMPIVM